MVEPVDHPDDDLEPIEDQGAAKLRTLELELVDDAEDLLHLAAELRPGPESDGL